MRLEIENINKIKEASIQMNGLTVIVGENSTGKSTIGRILFSTIKALLNTITNDEKTKDYQIRKHVISLYERLTAERSVELLSDSPTSLFPKSPKVFFDHLNQIESVDRFINECIIFVENQKISPRQKKLLKKDLSNIREYKIFEKVETRFSSEIQYLIESEFLNKVCSNNSESGKVSFIGDDDVVWLEYEVTKNNEINHVVYSKDGDFFKDATYIESPLYLHLQDVFNKASVYRELAGGGMHPFLSMIPLHIKDASEKMDFFKFLKNTNNNEISDVISGTFSYNEETKNIIFTDNKGYYFPINVASGIKSFGVLQILLSGNFIEPNKILIWDEPENHLHPQWQIEFAKLLVSLTKSGIPILISTHSPYFLQAIRFYSAKESIDDYVNTYLAEIKDDGMAIVEDVTNDLSRVFVKLAKPLNDIMNVDMQRKKTRK